MLFMHFVILVYCVFCGLRMCCGFLVVVLRARCLFGLVWIVGLGCLFANFLFLLVCVFVDHPFWVGLRGISGWVFRFLVICLMFVALFVMGFRVRACDACSVVFVFVYGWWFKLEVCD